MKPPPFEYEAPSTVEEVVALLQQHDGEAKILAGGQSLMPLLNMRFARPSALIDLRRLTGLDYIREENGALAIGAMTTKRSVERSELVKSRQPLLHASTAWIAHPQIRNRGTVGGSMAHAKIKELIPQVYGRPPVEVADLTAQTNAAARAGAEGQEGLKAFLEKRKPSWIG